jgi:O-antigen ligase
VTSVALGLGLAELVVGHPRWAAPAMIVLVLAAAAVFVRTLGSTIGMAVLLVTTCLIDRDTFPVGGVNIRPEQIAAVLLLVTLLATALSSKRAPSLIKANRIELALVGWFAVALVSSLIEPPNRLESLKIVALLLVSSLAFFLPRRLLAGRPGDLDQVIGWALLALAFESAYAWIAYVLHLLGPTISMNLNPATGHLNAYGTLWEPNVLGAVTGAGAVAWVLVGPRYFRQSWLGVGLCLTACVASFARAAWIAVVIVVMLALATPIRRRIDLRTLSLGALSATLMVAWIFASDRLGNYTPGGGGVSSSVGNSTDILGRLYQFAPALNDLKRSPILGGGVDSFGQRHILASIPEHIGNLELLIFHDTGAIGLIVFAAFVIALGVATWRHLNDQIVLGLAAVTLVIAIANQATETLELMITWLLLGLLLAAIDAAPDQLVSERSQRST